MEYVLDAILILVALAFLVGGLRRGPLAEGLTVGAVLLGALLLTEWGSLWGKDLAALLNLGDVSTIRFVVGLLLLLAPVAVIGYGGAFLLPSLRPLRAGQRALGGLLGLANGVALGAFALRSWFDLGLEANPGGVAGLLADPVTAFYLNWAGWWPLVLLAGGVAALLAGLLRPRPRRAPPPRGVPAPPGTPAPAPIPPGARPLPPAEPVAPTALVPLGVLPVPPLAEREAPSVPLVTPPAAAIPPARPLRDSPPAAAPANGTATLRCRTCGKPLLPGAAFCTNCGTPVEV